MNKTLEHLKEKAMRPTGIEGLGGSYMEVDLEVYGLVIVEYCCLFLNQAAEVDNQAEQDVVDRAAKHIREYFGL